MLIAKPVVASLLSLLLALAAPVSDLGEGGHTPVPDDEIPELTDFASLQERFSQDTGYVRLVALLSPSCGYCLKGYRYMRKLLDEIPDERLRMYVVWEPMLSGDSRQLAERVSRKAQDPRMVYQAWDAERITGRMWQNTMNLDAIAWDVYFLYDGTARWPADGPTRPLYWQQQGQSPTADRLDYELLKAKIEDMLAQVG